MIAIVNPVTKPKVLYIFSFFLRSSEAFSSCAVKKSFTTSISLSCPSKSVCPNNLPKFYITEMSS